MESTEAVDEFREWVAKTTEEHPAPALVQAVLSAVGAFAVDAPAPGCTVDTPSLPAGAMLDVAPWLTGLAASPRTALALYDAHESWSGGVDDLEAEQARDLVARIAALAAVAAGLDADPEQGLARLLDDAVGRALVTVFVAIEIVLARGTAFEPVEPGVIADDVAAMEDLVSEVFQSIADAGGPAAGATTLMASLLSALDDAADSLGDQIEEIAEAVRAQLPEQSGDRDAWQAEARELRVYGLLVARLTAGAGASTASKPAPSREPQPDLGPLRERLDQLVARQSTVTAELARARERNTALVQEREDLQERRPAADPVAIVVPEVGPALHHAVEDSLESLQSARSAVTEHEARLAELQPPTAHAESEDGEGHAARAAIAAIENDITALRAAIDQAEKQRQSAAERQHQLQQQLQALQQRREEQHAALEQHRAERRTLQKSLEQAQQNRASHASSKSRPARSARTMSVRERALLRGTVLRARAQAVNARAELATLERNHKPAPPPSAPKSRSGPDLEAIQRRIGAAETEIQRLRDAIAHQRKAQADRVRTLKARLDEARARRTTLASTRQQVQGRRKRHAKNLASARKAHAKSAERPEPVAREIADTLAPGVRESLEDAVFEANNRLHRARWSVNQATARCRTEQPEPPQAPKNAHVYEAVARERKAFALAEEAVAEVRARLDQAVAGRTSIIADLESRRLPGKQRLTELQAIRAELAASHNSTTEGQRDRTDRLASLVAPPPWPQAPPPELQAQQNALGALRDAIADARSTLKAITAQGASLPLPPDPRAPHQPRDLSALRAVVVQAERAAREAEARKAKMLAELAELRAPLAAEHRVLTDRKTRLDKALQRFRKRRDAGRRRLEGLHNRQAAVRDALQQVQPEAIDLVTEPTAARDAAVNALQTATAILQQRTTAERVLRDTPPAAAADPAPAQEATATARLLVEMCTAAVRDVESRIGQSLDLGQRHTAAQRKRDALVPLLDQARARREAVLAEQAALTQKTEPIRASIDALQPVQQSDTPELTLLRQVATAAKEAVHSAKAAIDKLPGPPDPPTVWPDRREKLVRKRKAKATAVQKLEAAARKTESKRDQGYVALRQEHRVALERARPTRKLQALRRRRQALERARKARADRRTSLSTVLSAEIAIDPRLRPRVTEAADRVQSARALLGERVSAVADHRSQLGRKAEELRSRESEIEAIDEALARWTRRSRRAERAVQKLKQQIAEAQAAAEATPPDAPSTPSDDRDATDIHDGAPSAVPPLPPEATDDASSGDPPPPEQAVTASTPPAPKTTGKQQLPKDEDSPPETVPVLPPLPDTTPPPPPPGLTPASARPPLAVPPPPERSPVDIAPPAIPPPEASRDAGSVEPPTIPPPAAADGTAGTPPPVPASVQSLLARIAANRGSGRRTPTPATSTPAPPPLIPGLRTERAHTPPKLADDSPFEAPAVATVTMSDDEPDTPDVPVRSRFVETEAEPPLATPKVDLDGSDLSLPPPIPAAQSSKKTSPAPVENTLDDALDQSDISLPAPVLPPPGPPPDLPPDPGLPPLPPVPTGLTDPSVVDDPSMPIDPGSAIRAVTLSNEPLHNARTVILSREELLRRAMLEDDDDDDDDDSWDDDGAKTMLLSRDEQIRRRDALLAERDAAPKRRREQWTPPTKSKK